MKHNLVYHQMGVEVVKAKIQSFLKEEEMDLPLAILEP
jgi:hypothetical protein